MSAMAAAGPDTTGSGRHTAGRLLGENIPLTGGPAPVRPIWKVLVQP